MNCEHGMPSRASCVDCMLDGPVAEPVRWVKVGKPFTSRYGGFCVDCDTGWGPGEQIQRWDYGDFRTVYAHPNCKPSLVK